MLRALAFPERSDSTTNLRRGSSAATDRTISSVLSVQPLAITNTDRTLVGPSWSARMARRHASTVGASLWTRTPTTVDSSG